jgi:hypothetical protein
MEKVTSSCNAFTIEQVTSQNADYLFYKGHNIKIKNPFHPGEVFIQEEADEREMALLNGRMYEDVIMMPAHKFISQQYFIAMSAFSNGEISATILYGNPGFTSPDETGKNLFISLTALKNADQDPVISQLKIGDAVGTLAIELSSRRTENQWPPD